MKGVELPTNTIIAIALGLLVMALVSVYFIRSFDSGDDILYENALNMGCKDYALNPTGDTSKVTVGDVDNDGEVDSLLEACQLYSKNPALDSNGCVKLCQARFPSIPDPNP